MKNTKQWWSCLSKKERRELMVLQMSPSGRRSSYLPDGYSECGNCSTPASGVLCRECFHRMNELIHKADMKYSMKYQ